MRNRNNQQGFLTFTGVLMLVVVAAAIFLAFKLMPPYVSNYQLQDSINNIARTATYSSVGEDQIRKDVIKAAHDSGIELAPNQVSVGRSRESVDIAVAYSVTVDLMVKPVTMNFNPSAGNRLITAK